MNITAFQKKAVLISTLITSLGIIGGSAFKVYDWVDSSIVTKVFLTQKLSTMQKQNDISTNDIRLLIIEQGLSSYYSKGLGNLSDQENHHYNKLILAEATNETRRNVLLGL